MAMSLNDWLMLTLSPRRVIEYVAHVIALIFFINLVGHFGSLCSQSFLESISRKSRLYFLCLALVASNDDALELLFCVHLDSIIYAPLPRLVQMLLFIRMNCRMS